MNEEKIKQSSFVEHLSELRSRLIKSVVYLFIFFIICYFFAENIYTFLVSPYADAVKNDDINQLERFLDNGANDIIQITVSTKCANDSMLASWSGSQVQLGLEVIPGSQNICIFHFLRPVTG